MNGTGGTGGGRTGGGRTGRVVGDDRTARAVIRDEALRLFAAHGPDAVTIRQIAAAAGVSPALVVHHFGGRAGLRSAVDAHVVAVVDDLCAADLELTGAPVGVADAVLRRLPPESPVPAYLRRLLLDGGPAGAELFAKWFDAGRRVIGDLVSAGQLDAGADPAVRAAFLLANDLALLLLREHLAALLGTDPLGPAGLARWTAEALAVYRGGLFSSPP